MGADAEYTAVAVVQVRLEDQDLLLGDEGPADTPEQLFGLTAEHHARYYLDPAVVTAVVQGGLVTDQQDDRGDIGHEAENAAPELELVSNARARLVGHVDPVA